MKDFNNVLERPKAFSRHAGKTEGPKRLLVTIDTPKKNSSDNICLKRKKLAGIREIKIAAAMYVAETWIFLSE